MRDEISNTLTFDRSFYLVIRNLPLPNSGMWQEVLHKMQSRNPHAFAGYRSGAKLDAKEDMNEQDHPRPTSTIKAGGARDLGYPY